MLFVSLCHELNFCSAGRTLRHSSRSVRIAIGPSHSPFFRSASTAVCVAGPVARSPATIITMASILWIPWWFVVVVVVVVKFVRSSQSRRICELRASAAFDFRWMVTASNGGRLVLRHCFILIDKTLSKHSTRFDTCDALGSIPTSEGTIRVPSG